MLTIKQLKERRKNRSRYQLKKSSEGKLRLSVFRSGKNIHAQIIDDIKGNTVISASTIEKSISEKIKSGSNIEAAVFIGNVIAERAKEAGIENVVFDRGSFKYHGRVKALADAARSGGLKF